MIEFTEIDGGVTFRVRVVPRSSKSAIAGELDGALKIRIASPPVDGAANEELIRFLSKSAGVAKSSIAIIAGVASKLKTVRIEMLSGAVARERLIGAKTA